jgi:hypothetical protein
MLKGVRKLSTGDRFALSLRLQRGLGAAIVSLWESRAFTRFLRASVSFDAAFAG